MKKKPAYADGPYTRVRRQTGSLQDAVCDASPPSSPSAYTILVRVLYRER